ncbi:MAG: hypothetical protein EXS48_03190 [Candidatus Staskawiczbacteria bacterium]|nr:hypothetical protein [Candidatus Staskawiczbacteria bacterium]
MLDEENTTQNEPSADSSPASPSSASETSPEPQNASTDGFTAESTNSAINKGDAEISQPKNEPESAPNPENQGSSEPGTSQTAQTPVNEPLEESETSNEQAKPVSENSKPSLARQLLISARNAIQFRKRKKLDRVMSLFLQQSKITNDEVEKFLHVSDATATRYLSILEKENKIKQVGKTGKAVSYSRV